METSEKQKIKDSILEIFDRENRSINIRELTSILKREYKIIKSEPFIKKFLNDLVKEGELSETD